MKLREMLTAVLSVAAIGIMYDSAMAKEVSIKGHDTISVKVECTGTYFAPGAGGAYGCLNEDNSGIICGGTGKNPKTGKDYSKTCETFRKAPPCLPTRDAIRKAVEAEQTDQTEQTGQGVVYAGKWCCASCSKNATTGALECTGCAKGRCTLPTADTGYLNVDCPGNTTESGTNVTCY